MDKLTPVEGGYHCDNCEKKVYDVSHMTTSEFKTLQDTTKDLCISFKKVTTMAVMLSTSNWVAADNNISSLDKTQTNSYYHFPYGVQGKPIRYPKQNTFKLEKIKVIPIDNNSSNNINSLSPPVECNVSRVIPGKRRIKKINSNQ